MTNQNARRPKTRNLQTERFTTALTTMTVNPKFTDLRSKPDVSIDMTPVRKSNWKTGGARDYWDPKIRKFRFNIPIEYLAEVLADSDHPQDVAVIRIGENRLMELAGALGDKDLSFNQISNEDSSKTSIFTQYPNPVDVGGMNKQNIAIGINGTVIDEFIEAITTDPQTEEAYRTAAEYIGMPDCCTDFHVDNALALRGDPVYDIACNTPSAEIHEDDRENVLIRHPDPFLNIFWRYNGWRLIHHLPCSFECEESGEIARRNYDAISDVCGHKHEAEHLLAWLDQPMEWTGYHSLVNMRNAYGIGSYTTDNYWSKKNIVWKKPHQDKPDFEPNHLTTPLEPLDPDRGAF